MAERTTVRVVRGLAELMERPAGCAATIGNFDGVHLGHQRILGRARAEADRLGSAVVAMTFEPPPARLLAPEKAPEPLMHLEQRCAALGVAGADIVLVIRTTRELLNMTPETFIRQVLIERLGPSAVVEGDNFFFGHNRAGNVDTLRAFGAELGFAVHVVEPVLIELEGRTRISSSLIRQLVRQGRLEDAARGLGRPYTMRGRVVPGRGEGRRMSYPTINLDCGQQLLPADGVYAGTAVLPGDRQYPAALSVGTRPTFGPLARAVEAHLLDYQDGSLYGAVVDVRFLHHLRTQRRFPSAEALRLQMDQDVRHVRELVK